MLDMLEGRKAVIFDLDGTLMDSMWMWRDIDIEYLGRYGYTPPEGLEQVIEGMGFTETAQYFKERFQLPDSIGKIKEDWLKMAWDKYAHEVKPKPGAVDFLRAIRKKGLRVGIASSNSRDLILACLEGNQIADCFDCIVTSCDVAKGKPAPDVYLKAAELLGAEPETCLVFEDVPAGILAGKRAGMHVGAVEDVFSLSMIEGKKELADFYIRDYRELIQGAR